MQAMSGLGAAVSNHLLPNDLAAKAEDKLRKLRKYELIRYSVVAQTAEIQ